MFQTQIILPAYSDYGDWIFNSISCQDATNHWMYYSSSASFLYANLSQVAFSQLGTIDNTPPTLLNVSVSPRLVDTTAKSASILVAITVSDKQSGVSHCNVYLSNPSHSNTIYIYLGVNSAAAGQIFNTTLSQAYSINQYSANATYTVTTIECCDQASNCQTQPVSSQMFPDSSFTQFSNINSSPPIITLFRFLNSSVNVTFASQQIQYTLGFQTNIAGLSSCQVSISMANQISNYYLAPTTTPHNGTDTHGFLYGSIVVPKYSSAGTLAVTQLSCTDRIGGTVSFTASNLGTVPGFADVPSVTIFSSSEGSNPQITRVSLSPSNVSTLGGAAIVEATISFITGFSGIYSCSLRLTAPATAIIRRGIFFSIPVPIPPSLLTGNSTHGTIRLSAVMPQYSVYGIWTVSSVYCSDNAGLSTSFATGQGPLANVTVFQGGLIANRPPTISFVHFTPTNIDTSRGGIDVTVSVGYQTSTYNISRCSVTFTEFISQTSVNVIMNQLNISSGNLSIGSLSSVLTFPAYSATGPYVLTSAICWDIEQNSVSVSTSTISSVDVTSQGIMQVGTADMYPPVASSLDIFPLSINTSQTDALVKFTLSASDDLSGVMSCLLTLQPPPSSSVPSVTISFSPSTLAYGTALNGGYIQTFSFPRFSASGLWRITTVQCTDNAGYTASTPYLNALGFFAEGITQIGASDPVMPNITSFSITSQVIDTDWPNNSSAWFEVGFSDVGSGVASCEVQAYAPAEPNLGDDGSSYEFNADMKATVNLVTGTLHSGTMRAPITLPGVS